MFMYVNDVTKVYQVLFMLAGILMKNIAVGLVSLAIMLMKKLMQMVS